MKLIKETIRNYALRYIGFFKDAGLNMLAFSIYICSQQIVLFPILAKILDENNYANIIMCITIMNVFCNVLGGQLGVTHQLEKSKYEENHMDSSGDFTFLMLGASLIITIGFSLILFVLRFDLFSIIFLMITALFSNFRLYIRYVFRIQSKYKKTIFQNVFYLIGISCGLVIFQIRELLWIPLFCGELFAFLYTLFVIKLKRSELKRTFLFSGTLQRYSGLGAADALTNIINVFDKVLIYPLLGAYSLAVYNAGSAVSKITALVINPLNEVLLVKLSKSKDQGIGSVLKSIMIASLFVVLGMFVFCVPVIYIFSFVLYEQYWQDICAIICLLSLRCALSITTDVMKSFILRLAKPSQLTKCYIFKLIIMVISGYIGAKWFGLVGYASAMAISSVILWLLFIYTLIKCYRGDEKYGE